MLKTFVSHMTRHAEQPDTVYGVVHFEYEAPVDVQGWSVEVEVFCGMPPEVTLAQIEDALTAAARSRLRDVLAAD